jgi:hypothetical protein
MPRFGQPMEPMRRAVDPAFDAQAFIPVFMDIIRHMLRAGPARRSDNEEPSS